MLITGKLDTISTLAVYDTAPFTGEGGMVRKEEGLYRAGIYGTHARPSKSRYHVGNCSAGELN